jgi:hypothetical protein
MKQVVGTSFLTTCPAKKPLSADSKKGKGTGYVRLLAYRNKTIEKLNVHIRNRYGENQSSSK